ncbi:MFS transporter [Luteococcus sp. H138]|uniref:MFS transporter n=1 Tax=unclassified Luteococcus TaxID=2639923 RepID=UPI00313EC8B8
MLRWCTPGYVAWIVASTVSALGGGVLTFALVWTATGISGTLAGTLSAVSLVPTTALLLIGGALGDSLGQRRLLQITTVVQVLQGIALWILLHTSIPLVAVLIGNAIVAGALQGLGSPSSVVYARQFVPVDDVKAAMAVASAVGSITRMAGPSLGALALAAVGLSGSVLVNAVSFAGVLFVLFAITPATTPAKSVGRTSLRGHVVEGAASVWRHRTARVMLLSTGLVAGSLLPVVGLGIPLLVRSHQWPTTVAGLLEGCWLAGSLVVSLIVSARYARQPHARASGLVSGPLLAALGVVAITGAPNPAFASVACVVMGMGTSLFTANVAPVLTATAPPELQSRWSAITALSQFLPLIVVNPVLGIAADHLGTPVTLLGLAVPAAAAGVLQAHHRFPDSVEQDPS